MRRRRNGDEPGARATRRRRRPCAADAGGRSRRAPRTHAPRGTQRCFRGSTGVGAADGPHLGCAPRPRGTRPFFSLPPFLRPSSPSPPSIPPSPEGSTFPFGRGAGAGAQRTPCQRPSRIGGRRLGWNRFPRMHAVVTLEDSGGQAAASRRDGSAGPRGAPPPENVGADWCAILSQQQERDSLADRLG